MRFIVNPGTEPVPDTTEANAIENIRHFITDLEGEPAPTHQRIKWLRLPEADHGGRYGFLIWSGNHCHEIDMPGCSLERVRKSEPFYSPRLYVDGSSWLWGFGLGMCFSEEE